MADSDIQQIPGVYHRRIGDIVVTAIADGFLDGDIDVLLNITQEESRDILSANFRPARRTAVNTFLVRSSGEGALMETGCGTYMQPTAGKQIANLAAAGVKPSEIDAILLTHMHPDHSAGLTDRDTGKPFFENAELIAHENEPKHWLDDSNLAKASEREKLLFFQCTREQIAPYKDRMRLFTSGEVFPGITAIPRPGHTPGHTTYLISSGDDQLLIWGDTIHVPEIQTAQPEVCIAFDSNPTQAEASRRAVFDMVATDRLLFTGMHMHFPGFSRLVEDGSGYRIIPAAWEHEI
ncbi:MAG: MBL fold metallo-hydrolase [Hyphomicrobiaceae bacterium TMED74]|nr:MBL fold metallo-hydrolase [Filomicrobium sp.]RPG38093.1 MAG: MBL fold metallo-hydrolase [Hyphomicrobiaceae bacterium TMED74]